MTDNQCDFYLHPTATLDGANIFRDRYNNKEKVKITFHRDNSTKIGDLTKIWHYSHISKNVEIGEKVTIGQNVYVAPGVKIGDGCKIQNNVSLYEGVVLEDYVFVGPSAVFTNVLNPRAEINRQSEYRTTIVRRGATIGANATIVCGTEIGRYAFIGAGAVVSAQKVPQYGLMLGVPVEHKGWMGRHGYKLREETEFIENPHSIFRNVRRYWKCPFSGWRYSQDWSLPGYHIRCETHSEEEMLNV